MSSELFLVCAACDEAAVQHLFKTLRGALAAVVGTSMHGARGTLEHQIWLQLARGGHVRIRNRQGDSSTGSRERRPGADAVISCDMCTTIGHEQRQWQLRAKLKCKLVNLVLGVQTALSTITGEICRECGRVRTRAVEKSCHGGAKFQSRWLKARYNVTGTAVELARPKRKRYSSVNCDSHKENNERKALHLAAS